MPEEERNKYYEQARQATLAEIAGNQQDMLEQPVPEPMETEAPEAPAIAEAPAVTGTQAPVGYDEWLDKVWGEKAAMEKQAEIQEILDPRVQRAESSRRWVAGIGDAIASMANLVGTAHDASNQRQTYMLPAVDQAIEQDRAKRQAQHQRQLDRINKLQVQQLKEQRADARTAAQVGAQNERAAADRAVRQADNEAAAQLARDKFEYGKELDNKKLEETQRHNKVQESQGWSRIARMKDNRPGSGDTGGSDSRYSGRKGGGIKDAKTDYNAMLDEIAVRAGATDWADLSNRSKNDRSMRELYNKFDLGKDKAGNAKIEGMISNYARNYAPEFHEYYFGKDGSDKVDFSGFKSKKKPEGTLSGIMKKKNK